MRVIGNSCVELSINATPHWLSFSMFFGSNSRSQLMVTSVVPKIALIFSTL
ncbi:hypothetical protein D3C84_1022100 [compost metagenome]